MKIAVIGAGAWGTTLANLLSETNDVELWVREKELFNIMCKERENKIFLPGIRLNDNLKFSESLDMVGEKELIVIATPAQFVRETAKKLKEYIKDQIIVSISKGLEIGTDKRMSEVLEEELGSKKIAALSGPNHAEEVSRKIPTATVIASKDGKLLKKIQPIFNKDYFKVYPLDDIVGVELCNSIKNIIAIACGVVDGLGYGDNTKASVITLGLTEMNNFSRHFGAKRATIYGLAGVGDLIATCTSKHSRNRFVGERLAQGKRLDDIKKEMSGRVAEGVTTTKAVYEFSIKNKIDMKLTTQLYNVLYENKDLKRSIKDLIISI